MFRATLEQAVRKKAKGPGGRRRFNVVMMFKILVLARLFNLCDEQTEYQINDRISFMRFLDLGLNSMIPDAKTIAAFRYAKLRQCSGQKNPKSSLYTS